MHGGCCKTRMRYSAGSLPVAHTSRWIGGRLGTVLRSSFDEAHRSHLYISLYPSSPGKRVSKLLFRRVKRAKRAIKKTTSVPMEYILCC